MKDGVIVVKEVEFEDCFENMGVKLVVEVVQKIFDFVGDGIMMVMVLVCLIFWEGFCNIVVGSNLIVV